MAVLFSVSSSVFEVGDQITLNATIIDASTNTRIPGSCSVDLRFFDVVSDGCETSWAR